MLLIEITEVPSVFGREAASYTQVQVEGHPLVLVRKMPNGWLYLAPDGEAKTALSQREAVCGALGIDLPNWRE
jgi:hypothetical protein